MEFFCTCPTGFEPLLAGELESLQIGRIRPLTGLVSFEGPLAFAYTVCMCSRLASRVVAVLARGSAQTADELYETACSVAWQDHIAPQASFAVDASGINEQLRNTQFTALRIKDAITDTLYARTGTRPTTSPQNPDVTVVARISKNRVTLGLDLAGAPLFRRGYERFSKGYQLRPDYAAALLTLIDWPLCVQMSAKTDQMILVDTSPTVSTLLIEAALSAAHRAPGLVRLKWGFDQWLQHDAVAWSDVCAQAQDKAEDDIQVDFAALQGTRGLRAVRSAIRAAGLTANVSSLAPRTIPTDSEQAYIVGDLSSFSTDDLVLEADALRDVSETTRSLKPFVCGFLVRDKLLSSYVAQDPALQVRSRMGKQDVYFDVYHTSQGLKALPEVTLDQQRTTPVLVSSSDQFAARLKKVARLRERWAKRTDVSCYRIYDADLPDYAVALDLYQGCDPSTGRLSGERWLQISEYAAPKSVDATLAQTRLLDVLALAPAVLGVEPSHTYLHVRRHSKGGSQYHKEAKKPTKAPQQRGKATDNPLPMGAHLIDEGGLIFEVNFTLRHDCGIFLDNRETRSLIREMAKETKGSKRFLNLFAYTGTATCYAADGGARHTTTVDLSRPSLDWAKRNMQCNGFVGREHEYVQADVLTWVSEQRHTRNRWDLIFCDVPTFSNSSRMRKRSFDVQRDHAELIIGVSRLLTKDGICVFSCNLKKFVPDTEKLRKAGVVLEDITQETIPEDFARNASVHHVYLVRRSTPQERPYHRNGA